MKPLLVVAVVVSVSTMLVAQNERQGPTRTIVRVGSDRLTTNLRCRIGTSNVVLTPVQPEMIVACPGDGVLRCDGEYVEPVDAAVANVCRSRSVAVVSATPVTVAIAAPTRLSVEWLKRSPEGHLDIVASRDFMTATTLTLPVVNASDRLVRFSRIGASPVTVHASELWRNTWQLPVPRTGGEFVGLLKPSKVSPIAYQLSGPQSLRVVPAWDTVNAYGLRAGNYDVQPEYEGGLIGKRFNVHVEAERSTVLWLAEAEVGGVTVSTDSSICAEATGLSIARVSIAQSGAVSRLQILRAPNDGQCHWAVSGLPPGRYEANVALSTGSAGSAPFAVRSQEIADVSIAATVAFVSGVVRLGDKPLVNSTLDFAFASREQRPLPVSVSTDDAGRFRASLAQPGPYTIVLRDKRLLSARTVTRSFAVGSNVFDWDVPNGKLLVRLKGHRREAPVTIHVHTRRSTTDFTISVDSKNEITRQGLDFDTYRVSASQEGGLVSELKTVSLDTSQPSADVDLELSTNRSSLVLTKPDGHPASGARISVMKTPSDSRPSAFVAIELEPGVYSLSGLSQGTQLLIDADGFVPSCRIVPLSEVVFVTLETGRSVEVRFPSDVTPAAMNIVMLSGVPGSECPIPLLQFQPQRMSQDTAEQPGLYRMLKFPTTNELILERPGLVRQVLVPDNGLIVVQQSTRSKTR